MAWKEFDREETPGLVIRQYEQGQARLDLRVKLATGGVDIDITTSQDLDDIWQFDSLPVELVPALIEMLQTMKEQA